ncbi:hypothetical protein [Legionella sainthelensi]|nr:hypothetical protein [Legionella sainthelensi]
MALKEAIYVHCLSNKVVKNGKSLTGEQRNKCRAFIVKKRWLYPK